MYIFLLTSRNVYYTRWNFSVWMYLDSVAHIYNVLWSYTRLIPFIQHSKRVMHQIIRNKVYTVNINKSMRWRQCFQGLFGVNRRRLGGCIGVKFEEGMIECVMRDWAACTLGFGSLGIDANRRGSEEDWRKRAALGWGDLDVWGYGIAVLKKNAPNRALNRVR